MADLAEEAHRLLMTSRSRWGTLRTRGREWRDTALLSEAWHALLARKRSEGQRFSPISNRRTSPIPNEMDDGWRLSIAEPWKRATFVAGRSDVDVVFHQSTWWSNGHGISRTNGGAPRCGHGEGPGAYLVATAGYPALIAIGPVEIGERLGRETLDARVRIRHGLPRRRGRGLHGLIIGDADDVRLVIDRERGVILSAANWFRGSVYQRIEMDEVAFDEPLAPEAFDIAPLPGLHWIDLGQNPSESR